MALGCAFGWSEWELMRLHCKPCSRLTRHTTNIFIVGSGLTFWVLCKLHYGPRIATLNNTGPRIATPRSLRWASCGAISVSSTSALLVHLFSPEC